MKKSSKPEEAQDAEANRRKKLQFKKKKARSKEQKFNYKKIKSIDDLDEYGEYNF